MPGQHNQTAAPGGQHATPRWPAAAALLAVGMIYLLVSDQIAPGPRGLVLAVVAALIAALAFVRWRGYHHITRALALGAVAAVTLALIASVVFLVAQLLRRQAPASPELLVDAALIWLANVLTFAVGYWELDAGGPSRRHAEHHTSSDFVFPQMTIASDPRWSPAFIDYLFLAFNTSTAFSPTDTLVLSRRAKLLMMLQSLVALVVVAVLAARAINTL